MVQLLHSPAWDEKLEQDVFKKPILLHTVMSQQTQNLPLCTTAVMLAKVGWAAHAKLSKSIVDKRVQGVKPTSKINGPSYFEQPSTANKL